MDREDKLRMIMMDDVAQEMRVDNAMSAVQKALDGGSTPRQIFDDEYQTGAVSVGETEIIYRHDVDPGEVIYIQEIANEWYPGIEYTLLIDDKRALGDIRRQLAPMNNPRDVEFFAEESIVWKASNNGSEERDLGVITGGKKITEDTYSLYRNLLYSVGIEGYKDEEEFITVESE